MMHEDDYDDCLSMESRTEEDVIRDAHPEWVVNKPGSESSNQRFPTNAHPEGLDDGVDEHGSRRSGPKPG